jgi:hypothetical protein
LYRLKKIFFDRIEILRQMHLGRQFAATIFGHRLLWIVSFSTLILCLPIGAHQMSGGVGQFSPQQAQGPRLSTDELVAVCRTVCSNADRQSVCVGKLRWLLAK